MFVLDLLPGGILCSFWLIHFISGTDKNIPSREGDSYVAQNYTFGSSTSPLHTLNLLLFEEIRNWKTNTTVFLLQNFPCQLWPAGNFHLDLFLCISILVQRWWQNILFYPFTAERKLFSCQVRRTFMAETVTPTFSQQLSVHHVSCSW